MHIVFGILGWVVVNHQGHSLDIQPSSSHVRRTNNLCVAVPEIVQSALTLFLLLVAMNGVAAHPRSIQSVLQLLTGLLRVTEDHRTILSAALLRDVIFQEELRQVTYLLVGVDNLHDLFDRIRSFQVLRAADLHLERVVHELGSYLLNIRVPCCCEEEGLPFCFLFYLLDRLANLRFETHVEHPVGFVHDQL